MRFLILFGSLSLFGKIIETPHFADLAAHASTASSETLFLLDIDDTLLVPVQTLGTDVWFQYQLEKNQKEEPHRDSLDKTLALWESLRHLTQIQVVEEGSEQLVATLQKQGISLMGLTTQGLSLATRTVNQLESLHFDLSRTAPFQHDCYFQNGHGVLFRKGILFTSGTHKGRALLKFLELTDCHPKAVVFINDKLKNLTEVEETMEQNGISFTGLRYSYSDERIARFRPEIAEIQLRYSSFEQILSDVEADRICSEQLAEIAQKTAAQKGGSL